MTQPHAISDSSTSELTVGGTLLHPQS